MATTIQRLMDWRDDRPRGDLIDDETVDQIEAYWEQGACYAAIATLVGVELETVETVINDGPGAEHYTPTPEEIKAGCEAIQAEWTPQERRERQTVKPVPWRVPETHLEIGGDDD